MRNDDFSAKVAGWCFTLIVLFVLLALLGTCFGTASHMSTTDYVREHGLPPDPHDNTPPANR